MRRMSWIRSRGRWPDCAALARAFSASVSPPKRSLYSFDDLVVAADRGEQMATLSGTSLAISFHFPCRVIRLSLWPRSSSPCTANTGQ